MTAIKPEQTMSEMLIAIKAVLRFAWPEVVTIKDLAAFAADTRLQRVMIVGTTELRNPTKINL